MTVLPEHLLAYLASRDGHRAGQVDRTLANLTARERLLVREAAVMGYVTGVQAGPGRELIPKDSQIVAEVVSACLTMPDLYPLLNAVAVGGAPKVRTEWGVRLRWDDGGEDEFTRTGRADAVATVDLHRQEREQNPGWRVTPELIRRTITTYGWETVEEANHD